MKSIKCNQCGFTGWATAGNCKRCGAPLTGSAQPSDAFRPKPNLPRQKPSFFQILKNDALSFIGIILPVVMWGIYIAVTFFGVSLTSKRSGTVIENSDANPFFLIAPIVLTILGAAFIFWRVNSITKIFESGEMVTGKITDISFFKDRGRIEFSYNFQRQNFESGSSIMKNSKTTAYRSGDEVTLIVDSSNPSRVFIQDLYV
jgi:hypothetical protein